MSKSTCNNDDIMGLCHLCCLVPTASWIRLIGWCESRVPATCRDLPFKPCCLKKKRVVDQIRFLETRLKNKKTYHYTYGHIHKYILSTQKLWTLNWKQLSSLSTLCRRFLENPRLVNRSPSASTKCKSCDPLLSQDEKKNYSNYRMNQKTIWLA